MPRYMTVGQYAQQMLEIKQGRRGYGWCYGEESLAIAAARVGGKTEKFVTGTPRQLCDADEELGGPMHSLALLGRRTHELESEYVREYAVDKEGWDRIWKRDYEGRQQRLIKFESVAGAEVEVKYFRLHHRRPSST